MALLIFGIVVFMAVHLLRYLAPSARAGMVNTLGANGYRAAHSIIAIASLALLIYGFGLARAETGILYDPPISLRHLNLALMLVATVLLAAAFLPAGYIATYSKFPLVLAIKIWAVGHLLSNGETAQVILFASFLAFGVILRILYKRRQRAGDLAPRPFKSWYNDAAAIVLGVLLYAVIYFKLHELLIGVPVAAM